MIYKNYIKILLLTTLFIIVIVQPFLFFLNYGQASESERYLNEWIKIKKQTAEKIDSSKMVVLSGSNTLFGVDTKRMESELGIPVLNWGTHASLGRYALFDAIPYLHKGDIVILPLEYPTYQDKVYDKEYLLYITAYDTDFFDRQPLLEKIKFIYKVSPIDLVKNIITRMKPSKKEESEYSSKYLNSNGDMTNNHLEKSHIIQPNKTIPVFKEELTELPTHEAKQELHEFLSWCKSHEVLVYASWPNYLYAQKKFNHKDEDKIKQIIDFYNSENVFILGDYKDMLYDSSLFYDTIYHLNEKGKAVHTKWLINEINNNIILSKQIESMKKPI